MRICVLDDDLSHTEFVTETLTAAGSSTCRAFTDGKALIHELLRHSRSICWCSTGNMPAMSGEVVLEWVTKNLTSNLPVLFLTSRSHEADIVAILNAGADDYIIKPVSRPLLLARVDTLLRRTYRLETTEPNRQFGIYEFDLENQKVYVHGAQVTLTQKEFDLALLLFRNVSRPLSRTHIRETVWRQDADVPSRTMDTRYYLADSFETGFATAKWLPDRADLQLWLSTGKGRWRGAGQRYGGEWHGGERRS